MGAAEVEAFLNYLAVNRRVAASTQSQALNAVVFLYDSVLCRPLGVMRGAGLAPMPYALAHKYPSASASWAWQFAFPSAVLRPWGEGRRLVRWHASDSTAQRAFKHAAVKAQVTKHVSVHCLRHAFASHLLAAGTDIRTIQLLLGHRSLETTMIYTHLQQATRSVTSPLDTLVR
jgi:hypothetical protein